MYWECGDTMDTPNNIASPTRNLRSQIANSNTALSDGLSAYVQTSENPTLAREWRRRAVVLFYKGSDI